MDSLNLSCEKENQSLSQIANFEEQRHVEFIKFGHDEENIFFVTIC